MAAYLRLDPQYVARFSGVWLWKDWPQREAMGFTTKDTGIDLVAQERDGGFCAIQCKFYAEDQYLPMSDLGTFFTLSGKGGFTSRLIISTTDKWSQNAEDSLQNQQIPVVSSGASLNCSGYGTKGLQTKERPNGKRSTFATHALAFGATKAFSFCKTACGIDRIWQCQ